jgi:hypothetical protein
MQFPKDKVKAWKILHDRQDVKKIKERFNVSYYSLKKVFEDFEGTATTYTSLDTYYTEKLVSLTTKKLTVPDGKFVSNDSTMADSIKENGGNLQTKLL